jgi:hypothetical protein
MPDTSYSTGFDFTISGITSAQVSPTVLSDIAIGVAYVLSNAGVQPGQVHVLSYTDQTATRRRSLLATSSGVYVQTMITGELLPSCPSNAVCLSHCCHAVRQDP